MGFFYLNQGVNMIKKIFLGAVLLSLAACATQENKIADYLKKNPKIVFDVIEDNPEQFIEVVNKAAKKAQELQYTKQNAELKQQQESQLKNPLKPELSNDRLLYGSQSAPIVIVEYADFQCPACRMAHESLKKIKEKYQDQIQFYYKHMPLDFHKMAMPAAKYYEAVKLVDKAKAEKFFNLVFEQQNRLRDEDFLKKTVKQLGINLQKVSEKLNSKDIELTINSDMVEFQKFGFTGTPVIVVNGVALHGAQPPEELLRIIELTKSK